MSFAATLRRLRETVDAVKTHTKRIDVTVDARDLRALLLQFDHSDAIARAAQAEPAAFPPVPDDPETRRKAFLKRFRDIPAPYLWRAMEKLAPSNPWKGRTKIHIAERWSTRAYADLENLTLDAIAQAVMPS